MVSGIFRHLPEGAGSSASEFACNFKPLEGTFVLFGRLPYSHQIYSPRAWRTGHDRPLRRKEPVGDRPIKGGFAVAYGDALRAPLTGRSPPGQARHAV